MQERPMELKMRNIILLPVFAIACESPTENASPEDVIESIAFEPGTVYTYSYSFVEMDSTFNEALEIIDQGIIEVISSSESESEKKTAIIHVESPRLNLERWIEIINTDGLQVRTLEYSLNATDETGVPRSEIHLRETFQIVDMN